MTKRRFTDFTTAEDFLNEVIFGGDDRTIVGELVETWEDEDAYEAAYGVDGPAGWGTLYAVWGTQAEVDAEIDNMGDTLGYFIDRKGQTGWPDEVE